MNSLIFVLNAKIFMPCVIKIISIIVKKLLKFVDGKNQSSIYINSMIYKNYETEDFHEIVDVILDRPVTKLSVILSRHTMRTGYI